MKLILRLAWRNLWRHPRRSGLTIAAIAFATFLLVVMMTLQFGTYTMMIENSLRVLTGHFQVQRTGYLDKPLMYTTFPNPQQLAEKIRQIPAVTAVTIHANGFALVSSKNRSYGVQVVGVDTASESQVSTIPSQIQQGRFPNANDAQEIVVGTALAQNLKVAVGDELTLLGSGRDGSIAAAILPIVGIFSSGQPEVDRNLIEMPLAAFQDIFSMENTAHALVGKVKNLDDLATVLTQIQTTLNTPSLIALDWNTLMPGLWQLIQGDMTNGWVMYGCLILIVTFSILNTFLMAVLERTHEFGVMLAIGAKPQFIGLLVILESLLLTLLGLTLGLSAGIAVTIYYSIHGFTYPGMEELGLQYGLTNAVIPEISLFSLGFGPAMVLLFTMIAALYPILRLRTLKPVEAMSQSHF